MKKEEEWIFIYWDDWAPKEKEEKPKEVPQEDSKK